VRIWFGYLHFGISFLGHLGTFMAFWKAVLASMTATTYAGIEGGVPLGTIEHGFTGGRAARDEFDHHGFSVRASEVCLAKDLYLIIYLRIILE
jgi:hypothetical protein